MELIFDILKKLKNYEIRQIRNHLKASPFEYEKVGKLFELVTRYPDKDENFFSQKIYETDADNTFRVTKSRLKRLLEDVVLNEKSLTGYSAEYINALLQSEKKVLQGEILLGRGAYLASKNLLLQAVSTSTKYSLHGPHFRGAMLLHRNQSVNMSTREFQKRSENLLELNRINGLVNEAGILHYSLVNIVTNVSKSDQETLSDLGAKLSRIAEVAEDTQSPLAQYYYFLSQIVFLQYTYRFAEAQEYCKKYLNLVQTEPAVHSQQRMGSALYQLAEVSYKMGALDDARKYSRQTLDIFSPDELNYLIVLELAFRIAFTSGNDEEAEGIAQEAFRHRAFNVSKMRAAKWHYFHANLQFKTGKVREAMLSLNDATALLSDKMGWNIAFRLLEIMILFESGHYDLLDSKILNMRQFVKRTQKNTEQYRSVILIQILMEWHKMGLDLKKAYPSIKKKVGKLNEYHQDVPFNPNSTELVRLEDWMANRVGKGK